MSGIFSQFGILKEVGVPVTVTSITFVGGTPNSGTVVSTAHGYRAGDVVTYTGATPSGYNASWTIQSVTNANTYVIAMGITVLANTAVQPTVSNVTKFGGGGVVSRFFEFINETLKFDRRRVMSNALTFNRVTKRADRFMPYGAGAQGDIVMEVASKGFAYWLSLMGFTVVQTGPADATAYTYTGTPGSMLGQSFAAQFGKPWTISQVVQPFNSLGAKVLSWKLSNAVDGILILTLTCAFQNEVVNVALAVPSYPSGTVEVMTFVGGSITMAGAAIAVVKDVTITCMNGLTAPADRRFINAGGLPAEMLVNNWRDYQWTATAEFSSMTEYNRFVSTTAAGTMASMVALWSAPTIITGAASTVPSFQVTLPNARFDGATPNITGPGLLMIPLGGPALNTNGASDDACTIAYVTGDSTA